MLVSGTKARVSAKHHQIPSCLKFHQCIQPEYMKQLDLHYPELYAQKMWINPRAGVSYPHLLRLHHWAMTFPCFLHYAATKNVSGTKT